MALRVGPGKVLIRPDVREIDVDSDSAAVLHDSGLWLPPDVDPTRDTARTATVETVASGAARGGRTDPLVIVPGARVLYNRFAAMSITDDLSVIRDEEILAVAALNPRSDLPWWTRGNLLLLLPLPWLDEETEEGILLPDTFREKVAQGMSPYLKAYDHGLAVVAAVGPQVSRFAAGLYVGDVVLFAYQYAVYATLPTPAGVEREHVFVRDAEDNLAALAVFPREEIADCLGEEALMLRAEYAE